MAFASTKEAQLSNNRFTRLGSRYILALSVIATVVIAGQILIQRHLRSQVSDSHVVNVAGKQRMLSQKIVKTILLLQQEEMVKRKALLHDLEGSLTLWKTAQHGLLHGNDSMHLPGKNSEQIVSLFERTNVHFTAMNNNATGLLAALNKDINAPASIIKPYINSLLSEESPFLSGMEQIVIQYDDEAQQKVERLSTMEYILLFVSILVIIIELLFVFRPTAIHVNETVNKLIASEKTSKQMANEIRELYGSLEKSYEQIAQINQPVENPRTYAKSDRGGNVIFITSAFTALSGKEDEQSDRRLSDLFDGLENSNDWMDELIDTVSEGKSWQGEVRFKDSNQHECWVHLIVTPIYNDVSEIEELVMMGSNITGRKSAERSINKKTQAQIDKRINQQKFRSVLILEGQEEERKRIAMDIHDGIGQMLTSLKYNVESIDLNSEQRAAQKLKEIDQLIKLIIKEVRKVTFNLKPTVLGDYGLQAALNVFTKEMGKLVDIKLVYQSEGEIDRLPQKVENNIFRITQEAINNAIKYSEADKIEVSLKQANGEVLVSVRDEGKGFDTRLVEQRSINIESGRGLFNMYERTEYINGTLGIRSSPGHGTTVTLSVPLRIVTQVESEIES